MSQTKLITISILLGALLVGTVYYIKIYESAEDCYVRKMSDWANTGDDKPSITKITDTSNPKFSVSVSKAYLSETSKSDADGSLRFVIKTYMDYCKVK